MDVLAFVSQIITVCEQRGQEFDDCGLNLLERLVCCSLCAGFAARTQLWKHENKE